MTRLARLTMPRTRRPYPLPQPNRCPVSAQPCPASPGAPLVCEPCTAHPIPDPLRAAS
jgi:hypothetical protein